MTQTIDEQIAEAAAKLAILRTAAHQAQLRKDEAEQERLRLVGIKHGIVPGLRSAA